MAKHIMIKYFDYCDKNDIKMYYSNTDSILIKENGMKFMTQFISDNIGDLKEMVDIIMVLSLVKINTVYWETIKIKLEIIRYYYFLHANFHFIFHFIFFTYLK
jgi:hypothetical protein